MTACINPNGRGSIRMAVPGMNRCNSHPGRRLSGSWAVSRGRGLIAITAGCLMAGLTPHVMGAVAQRLAHPATMQLTKNGHFSYRKVWLPPAIVSDQAPMIINYRVRLVYPAALDAQGSASIAVLRANWPGLLFPDLPPTEKRTTVAKPGGSRAASLAPRARDIASLFRPGLPLYLRYVLTRRRLSCLSSTDGIHFYRYSSVPRKLFPEGQLSAVQIPVGWIKAGGKVAPAGQAPLPKPAAPIRKAATLRISTVRLTTGKPRLSASLLASFHQQHTLYDTLHALRKASYPVTYRIVGPFASNQAIPVTPGNPGFHKTFALPTGPATWKTIQVTGSTGSRVVLVSAQLKPAPQSVYFAACTIHLRQAHQEELLFDGMQNIVVYVNGQCVAQPRHPATAVQADRHQVIVRMHAGNNQILVRLVSDQNSRAAFVLRVVRGNWRYQLALRQRLIAQFPDNPRNVLKLRQQIADLWRRAGYAYQTIATLAEILHDHGLTRHQRAAILMRQAALYHALGDTTKANAVLHQLLHSGAGVRGQGQARLRAAAMWAALGNTTRQEPLLASIAQDKTVPRLVRYLTGLAVAAANWQGGLRAKVPGELRTLAALFPTNSRMYKTLQIEAFFRTAQVARWTAAQVHTNLLKMGNLTTLPKFALKRLAGIAYDLHDPADGLALLAQLAKRPLGASATAWPVNYAFALAAAGKHQAAAGQLQALFHGPAPTIPMPYSWQSVKAWRLADLRQDLEASAQWGTIAEAGASLKPVALKTLLTYSPQRNSGTVFNGLMQVAYNLISGRQLAAGHALVRLAGRYFPDQSAGMLYNVWVLGSTIDYGIRTYAYPDTVIDLNSAALNVTLTSPAFDLRGRSVALGQILNNNLWQAGTFTQRQETCIRIIRVGLCWSLNSRRQLSALRTMGNLYLADGHVRAAVACLGVAAGMPAKGMLPQARRDLLKKFSYARNLLGTTRPTITADQRISLVLQDIQQALTTGRPRQAMRLYQRLIRQNGLLAADTGAGHWVPLRTIIIERIEHQGPKFVRGWVEHFGGPARRALRRAVLKNSVRAMARVVWDYPLTPTAPQAITALASTFLRRNQPHLALGAIQERLSSSNATIRPPSAATFSLALHAALAAQDPVAYARIAAMMNHVPGLAAPAPYAAALQAVGMTPTAGPQSVPVAEGSFATSFPFPLSWREAQQTLFLRHNAQVYCHPLCYRGTVYISTLHRVMALAPQSGKVLWQAASGSARSGRAGLFLKAAPLRRPIPSSANAAPLHAPGMLTPVPQTWLAAQHGHIYVRQTDHGHDVIQCRVAATGRLLWTSRRTGVLKNLAALSSPAVANGRVYAEFGLRHRRVLAALSQRTGRLLWTTPIIPAGWHLAGMAGRIPLPHTGTPPTCYGSDVYIPTNNGTVEDVNAATGTWRWLTAYPRSVLQPPINGGGSGLAQPVALLRRSAARIIATAHRLFVAPADALKLLCLQRRTGRMLWQRSTSARTLAGMARLGKHRVLLLQGPGLRLVSAVNGRSLWRWKPAAIAPLTFTSAGHSQTVSVHDHGPTLGSAAISGRQIFVSTNLGLYTVGLSTGKTMGFQPWNHVISVPGSSHAMTINQPRRDTYFGNSAPGNMLVWPGGGVLATGNGVLASLPALDAPSAVALENRWSTTAPATTLAPGGFAPGRPGDPLAILWRIGSGPVEQVLKPVRAAKTTENSWIVRFPREIVSFNPATGHVNWQRQSLLTATCVGRGRFLALVTPDNVYLRSMATGRLLWVRHHNTTTMVAVGKQYTILYDTMRGVVWARTNQTGRLVADWSVGPGGQWRNIFSASMYHGHVFTFIANNGPHTNIREYNPANGRKLGIFDLGYKPTPSNYLFWQATRHGNLWVIADSTQTMVFNLATKQTVQWPHSRFNMLRHEDGKLLRFYFNGRGYGGAPWRTAIMDPATYRVLLDVPTSPVQGLYYNQFRRYAGGLIDGVLVYVPNPAPGTPPAAVGTDLATGRQLWRTVVPLPPGGIIYQAYRLPGHMVYCIGDHTGRFRYVELDAHGKITASGFFPGWPAPVRPSPPAVVGNQILFSSTAGLYCLGPVAPGAMAAAATQQNAAGQIARLQRQISAPAIAIYPPVPSHRHHAVAAPAASHPAKPLHTSVGPAVQQPAAAWTAVFGARRSILGSPTAAPPVTPRASGRVRVTYTKAGLQMTLRWHGMRLGNPPLGAGPPQDDCILLGINATAGNNSQMPGSQLHTLLMAFWLANGRPRMAVLIKPFHQHLIFKPGRISYHLRPTMDGVCLRVRVPWGITINQLTRPGGFSTLRANAALFRGGSVLAWGHGLARVMDPHLWPLLKYGR